MWVYTEVGFFSIVRDYENEGNVLVRARLKEDAENMKKIIKEWDEEANYTITVDRDYLYRFSINKDIWSEIIYRIAQDIEYTNFKNHIHGNKIRDTAYMECWRAMNYAQSLQ